MAYSYITLAAARGILAERLADSGLVYYSGQGAPGTTAELNRYLTWSLRTWQAYTAAYHAQDTFSTSSSTPFYDLRTVLAGSSLVETVTDQDLCSLILGWLLEPPLTGTWTGTGMFPFTDIMAAIQQRLNRFLGETGVDVVRLSPQAASTDTVTLSDTVLDVRRAAWLSSIPGNIPTTLWKSDKYAFQSIGYGEVAQESPLYYDLFVPPPITLKLYPPPANSGLVDLLVVQSGSTVGTTPSAVFNTPVVLNIPNDLAWAVAFGAMSDLLSNDGPAFDPVRAGYCEQRYTEGVQLANLNPTVMLATIGSKPAWVGSVFALDGWRYGWQGIPGVPDAIGLAGRVCAAAATVPNGTYTVTLDLVCNQPVPSSDGSFLQIDRGALDSVIGYAQHLASLKMAGTEFDATEKLRQSFVVAAGNENGRLRQLAFYKDALLKNSRLQQSEVTTGKV